MLKTASGDTKDRSVLIESKLPCLRCGNVISGLSGILCLNYSAKRGSFKPCEGFWCAGCYGVEPEENRFPIKMAFDKDEEGIVVVDKKDKGRFLWARAGDHLMNSFQCDLCHFRNMRKRDPAEMEKVEDYKLLFCIRRCSLDSLWSREPTTVEHNRRDVIRTIKKGEELGHNSSNFFRMKQSRPLQDECFMALATTMMIRSLDKGKNDQFVQFSTVRSMRSAAGNYWKASSLLGEVSVLMRGQTKLISSTSPTNSEWYENFMLGYHKRVGDVSKPDRAVSIELMLAIMRRFELQWEAAGDDMEERRAVIFPALFSVCAYCASLRGEEVPLMDLGETRQNTSFGLHHRKHPHVVVSLRGRFKNEVGLLSHHIPLAPVTASGLNVQIWLERMLLWYGPHRKGYVFRDGTDNRVSAGYYAATILGVIEEIQQSGLEEEKDIVDPEAKVFEEYGMTRSFRRGSDSRALAAGVDGDTIDLVNRWRKSEQSKGRKAHLKMNAHYADIRLLLERFLVYSRSL